jgi:CubicO group peptidase (beta-lactamase class C family)
MRSTYFTVPPQAASRLATNYTFFAGLPLPLDPGRHSAWLKPPAFPYGGAGLVSSARDYDRFLHMLENEGELDGVRILKPEIARLAMSNLLPDGVDTKPLNAAAGIDAPLGFGAAGMVYLADVPGGPAKGTYGWAGAAGTLAWVDRTRKIRGVMMVNYFGRSLPIQHEIMRIVYSGK